MADACVCMGVSDDAIRQAVVEGAQTFEEVRLATGSSGGCGGCEEQVRQLISEATAEIALREPGLVAPIESIYLAHPGKLDDGS